MIASNRTEMEVRYRPLPVSDGNQNVGDVVSKNNQNTLLLNREFEAEIEICRDEEKNMHCSTRIHKMIAFQSDTRIFFFDFGNAGDLTEEEQKKRLDQCQSFLLMLYVAPIIRIMKMGTSFFNLLANTSFACILLLLFGGGILTDKERQDIGDIFDGHDVSNTAILIAVFSDLMHNILHASTRLWNLTRIDLPLVLALYVAYVIILWWTPGHSEWIYWYLIYFRFGCYYLSTSCNYWEDIMVLKIIRQVKNNRNFTVCDCSCKMFFLSNLIRKIGFPYHRLSQDDKIAAAVFKGSFCCWNWSRSSLRFLRKYHKKGEMQMRTSKWGHVFFLFGGVIASIVAFCLVSVLIILGSVPLSIAALIGFFARRCFCLHLNFGIFEEINLW